MRRLADRSAFANERAAQKFAAAGKHSSRSAGRLLNMPHDPTEAVTIMSVATLAASA